MASMWEPKVAPVKRKCSDEGEARKGGNKKGKRVCKETHSKLFDTCQVSFYGDSHKNIKTWILFSKKVQICIKTALFSIFSLNFSFFPAF